MRKTLKRVRPEDFDVQMQQLRQAAREGRLYIVEVKTIVSREQIIEEVRAYVGRIKVLTTPKYYSSVDEIWEQILSTNEFVDFLTPGTKARKCKLFDKYNVMRIIGVLRENGVYQNLSDHKFDALLEPEVKDSCYRKSLGEGLRQSALMAKLKKILWNLQTLTFGENDFFLPI